LIPERVFAVVHVPAHDACVHNNDVRLTQSYDVLVPVEDNDDDDTTEPVDELDELDELLAGVLEDDELDDDATLLDDELDDESLPVELDDDDDGDVDEDEDDASAVLLLLEVSVVLLLLLLEASAVLLLEASAVLLLEDSAVLLDSAPVELDDDTATALMLKVRIIVDG
jgi:hypothetical protein